LGDGYHSEMSWSAKQYVAFEDERTRPVRDLLSALPAIEARSVIDIGCGPGNSTEVLAARFPNAVVSGIDSSSDMINAARRRLPQLQFAVGVIESWRDPGPFDVILANAVLQWVPDHVSVLPALVAKLAPGGALAIQMPDNLDVPAHRLMRETAAEGPWVDVLAGASKVEVWRTTYYHPLAGGAPAIVEWFKGSGLRAFLQPLDEVATAAYLQRYTAAIAQAYPALVDGSVLLPFPRLFMLAIR
jgi:trans-aconitate 2-methyltransferase